MCKYDPIINKKCVNVWIFCEKSVVLKMNKIRHNINGVWEKNNK